MKPKRKAKAKRPNGRPTKYRGKFARYAAVMCKLGATDAQIAEGFGVSVESVYRWRQKHPEFCQSIKLAKDEADDQIERSLFERAKGYSHPDTHVSVHAGKVKLTKLTKHYPPETTAGIFWLKNRRPDQWRDRHELTGKGGAPLVPESPQSDLELARLLVFLLARGEAAANQVPGSPSPG